MWVCEFDHASCSLKEASLPSDHIGREFHPPHRHLNDLHSSSTSHLCPRKSVIVTAQLSRALELYHELHALDRFEQDYKRKLQEEDNLSAAQRGVKLLKKLDERISVSTSLPMILCLGYLSRSFTGENRLKVWH
ncbi:unnamed protein product, partial [Ilex paraguariensis]